MNETLSQYTTRLNKNPGIDRSTILQSIDTLRVMPPEDYVQFMFESNGAEGFLSTGDYFMLYPVEQLIPCNDPFGIAEPGPGWVIFGSDGSMTYYAFDLRQSPVQIVAFDPYSDCEITVCVNSLLELLQFLSTPEK